MFGITDRGNGWDGAATLPYDGVTDLTVSGNTFNVGYVDADSQITGEAVHSEYLYIRLIMMSICIQL